MQSGEFKKADKIIQSHSKSLKDLGINDFSSFVNKIKNGDISSAIQLLISVEHNSSNGADKGTVFTTYITVI